MNREKNLIEISYVRVSTTSVNQLSSIGNQINALKKYNPSCKMIVHQGSGNNNLNDELKNMIIENNKNRRIIKLNIIAFDRLTRNHTDLDFIRKYVRYIHVLSENITYDINLPTDYTIVTSKITEAVLEGKLIRQRCIRDSIINKLKKGNVNTTKTRHENSKKRCRVTEDNIIAFGINKKIIQQLKDFIHLSQNICSKKDWYKLFDAINNLGLDSNAFKKSYLLYLNKYESNDDDIPIYKILKNDVIDVIYNVFKKNNFEYDNTIFNGFVNSHYNMARDYDPNFENDIQDELIDIFDKLKISFEELKDYPKLVSMLSRK